MKVDKVPPAFFGLEMDGTFPMLLSHRLYESSGRNYSQALEMDQEMDVSGRVCLVEVLGAYRYCSQSSHTCE